MVIEPLESYPHKLEQSLRGQYPAQDDHGHKQRAWAEKARASGVMRLPGVLDAEHPEVLLLQEGTNGLNDLAGGIHYANNLRTMVSLRDSGNIDVIIANAVAGPPTTYRSA